MSIKYLRKKLKWPGRQESLAKFQKSQQALKAIYAKRKKKKAQLRSQVAFETARAKTQKEVIMRGKGKEITAKMQVKTKEEMSRKIKLLNLAKQRAAYLKSAAGIKEQREKQQAVAAETQKQKELSEHNKEKAKYEPQYGKDWKFYSLTMYNRAMKQYENREISGEKGRLYFKPVKIARPSRTFTFDRYAKGKKMKQTVTVPGIQKTWSWSSRIRRGSSYDDPIELKNYNSLVKRWEKVQKGGYYITRPRRVSE